MMRFRLTTWLMALLLGAAYCAPAGALSDVCEDRCFPRVDGGLFSCQRGCDFDNEDNEFTTTEFAREYTYLPVGLFFLNAKIQTRLKPPVIESLAITPEAPAPGDVLNISAILKQDDPEAEPARLVAYYSFDNAATWHDVPAEQDLDDGALKARIPLPTDASEILWFLRAAADENAYVEIPCQVQSFPFQPGECMIPMAADSVYTEDDYGEFHVDPGLDIVRSRVGEDDDSLYFSMEAGADVTQGETVPLAMTMFVVAVYDPAAWNRLEPLSNVAFLVYAPLLFHPEHCALIRRSGQEWLTDTGALDCEVDEKQLMFRVPRRLITKEEQESFNVFLGAGQILEDSAFGIMESSPGTALFQKTVITDYTGVTVVRPGARVIQFDAQE